MLNRKRTVEMHRDHTHFFTAGIEHIRRLFGDIADRAHADHDTFRVGRAVVIEKLVIAARDFIDLAHVFLDDFRNRLIVAVGRFAILEVNIRILRRAAPPALPHQALEFFGFHDWCGNRQRN